ncbi:MAG: four-helix bundle copper-binding protein, partial [Candidatus Angelobacter sp.]
RCYQTCLHEAMTHCLESGGKHMEPDHFRLMMDCAEICQTSTNFMLSSSAFSNQVCGVCADICDACAKSCEQISGMEDCAKVCRECAESCRQMAGSGANQGTAAQAHG